jgi:hypothetical protein
MNLFVGVMFSSFNDAINKEQKSDIIGNAQAEKYLDYITQIPSAKPDYHLFKKTSETATRQFFKRIITHSLFDNFIMMIIFLNLITMSVDHIDSSETFNNFSSIINYTFTAIFILESILKLLGLGSIKYFYETWNKFDFFVVVTSIIDLLVTRLTNANASFLKSFQILRVLRILRVTR